MCAFSEADGCSLAGGDNILQRPNSVRPCMLKWHFDLIRLNRTDMTADQYNHDHTGINWALKSYREYVNV